MSESKKAEIVYRKAGCTGDCAQCANNQPEILRKFFDWMNGTHYFISCEGMKKRPNVRCFSSSVVVNWKLVAQYYEDNKAQVEQFLK